MCAGVEYIKAMDALHSQQRSVGWTLGATQKDQLSKYATTPALIRLYQLLMFTMPGSPVFTYGDEIGLQAGQVSHQREHIFNSLENLLEQSLIFCLPPCVSLTGFRGTKDGLGHREDTC